MPESTGFQDAARWLFFRGGIMQSLTAHYRALLGLDDSLSVADVDLSLAEKRVVISLEFAGAAAVCPECGADCPLKDHAPERQWRHLDTMQFETVLKARVPRANCPEHGVRNMAAPW
ncbi:MAG: transposase family protein, partial [Planctomycetaceae bacterium]|nr:transposase family protein [Planctomycetaceae bacterium]